MAGPGSGAARRRAYFHLQQAAGRLRTLADRQCALVAGVTGPQAGALYAIAARPGGTQRALAAVLRQRESAVNGMISRLCAQDLVSRHRSASDPRAWQLDLTPHGHDTLEALDAALTALNAAIDGVIDGERIDCFVDALEALEATEVAGDSPRILRM